MRTGFLVFWVNIFKEKCTVIGSFTARTAP